MEEEIYKGYLYVLDIIKLGYKFIYVNWRRVMRINQESYRLVKISMLRVLDYLEGLRQEEQILVYMFKLIFQ